jgi:serine/threonine protein kinase
MNTETNIHDKFFGNIRYVAPEILRASKTKQDPYTEYSDIYSLGVLLWEISSGQNPFEDQSDYTIIFAILQGSREERATETPDKYYELYSKCWDDKPEKRCTIKYVYNALKKLLENDDKEIDDEKIEDKKVDDKEVDKGKINQILDLFYAYISIVLLILIMEILQMMIYI